MAQADHYIPEAFLKLWSYVDIKKPKDAGLVYQFDKEGPVQGWLSVSTKNAAKETGGDQLSAAEAKYFGVSTNTLDNEIIHPIEDKGIEVIKSILVSKTEINNRADFLALIRWIILQHLRTPTGKKSILPRNILKTISEVTGAYSSKKDLEAFCCEHGLSQNFLVYCAWKAGFFLPMSQNAWFEQLRTCNWVLRRVGCEEDVICGDHMVVKVETLPKGYFVPLGPKAVLFGAARSTLHKAVQKKISRRGQLQRKEVELVNGLLWENAKRFIWSRRKNPAYVAEGIKKSDLEFFEFGK